MKGLKKSISMVLQELSESIEHDSNQRWFRTRAIGAYESLDSVINICPIDRHVPTNEDSISPEVNIASYIIEKCKDQRYFTDYYVVRGGRTANLAISAPALAVAKTEKKIRQKLAKIVYDTTCYAARKTDLLPMRYSSVKSEVEKIKLVDRFDYKKQ